VNKKQSILREAVWLAKFLARATLYQERREYRTALRAMSRVIYWLSRWSPQTTLKESRRPNLYSHGASENAGIIAPTYCEWVRSFARPNLTRRLATWRPDLRGVILQSTWAKSPQALWGGVHNNVKFVQQEHIWIYSKSETCQARGWQLDALLGVLGKRPACDRAGAAAGWRHWRCSTAVLDSYKSRRVRAFRARL